MGTLAGGDLSCHTPRYYTLEAVVEGKLASEVFRPVREGLVAQGRQVERARLDVMVVNSCHLITTLPTVVDGTPRHRGVRSRLGGTAGASSSPPQPREPWSRDRELGVPSVGPFGVVLWGFAALSKTLQ